MEEISSDMVGLSGDCGLLFYNCPLVNSVMHLLLYTDMSAHKKWISLSRCVNSWLECTGKITGKMRKLYFRDMQCLAARR